jgi:hypothetical protein
MPAYEKRNSLIVTEFIPVFVFHFASNQYIYLRFEVLTAVVMKSTILWDISPCSPLSVNQCFGATYRLSLQGQKIRWARNQCESRWQNILLATCFHAGFLLTLFFRPWIWRRYVPPKRRLTLNGLHGIISHDCHLLLLWFLAQLISSPWRWRRCSSETSVDTHGLHGVISQKMRLFSIFVIWIRCLPC